MPRIKIKQLNERVATQGLHMGGSNARRKLQPGEVVEIPEDLEEKGNVLFDVLWNTGTVEMTPDPATRPLDYANYREGVICSPTFKPRGPDEVEESEKALAAVAARMETMSEPIVEVIKEKPQEKINAASKKKAKKKDKPASNRRAARRALIQADDHGEALTA